ncbi:hypothetical protein ACHWQZ_G004536 [Mnemiopsis leidyi]
MNSFFFEINFTANHVHHTYTIFVLKLISQQITSITLMRYLCVATMTVFDLKESHVFDIKDHVCFNDTRVCPFRIVNGSILTVIGIVGFIMSSSVVLLLVFNVIRLPGNKNIFVINVSMFDALLAMVGTIRGLGIISKSVLGIGEDMEASTWCKIFTIVAAPLWESLILSLLPLTVDRFVAVVFPTKYKRIITDKTSSVMVLASWLPLIILNLYDIISYKLNDLKIGYYHRYNRCVYLNPWKQQQFFFLLLPFLLIAGMYLIMIVIIIRNKIKATKLILTTSVIVATSLLTSQPFLLMSSFNITMSYEVSQILTVTCYYLNGIFNPLIYLCCNARVQDQLIAKVGSRNRSECRANNLSVTLSFRNRSQS